MSLWSQWSQTGPHDTHSHGTRLTSHTATTTLTLTLTHTATTHNTHTHNTTFHKFSSEQGGAAHM